MLDYNGITRDPAKLPESTIAKLLQSGFTHKLGNEAKAKANAKVKAAIGTDVVTTAEITAWRTAHKTEFAQFVKDAQDAMLTAIDNGTLGDVRTREPTDPIANEARKIARAMLIKALAAKSVKFDKDNDAHAAALTTLEARADIRTQAERIVAERAKAAGAVDLGALGL